MKTRDLLTVGLLLGCWSTGGLLAGESGNPPAAGLRPLQPGEDAVAPLEPLRPARGGEERLDAMAWYATGQVRESRGDFRGALRAYRRAIELDPERVAIYRAAVPLAFSLNETDDGLRYASKLVELDPNDVNLLQQLARVQIARGQIAKATSLLEKAVASDTVDRRSPLYVTLRRDLGVLLAAQGKSVAAATSFRVLFDALEDPAAYRLTRRDRAALLDNAEATYERLGGVFLEAGETDLAAASFQRAADARRDQPGVLQFDLARVALKAGKPEKALEQLDAYISAGRTDAGRAAYELLGETLTALSRGDELMGRLEAVVAAEPKNAPVRGVLADRLAAADRLEEAATLYAGAAEAGGDAADYLGLASVLRRQKRAADLAATLTRAAVAGAADEDLEAELGRVAEDAELTAAVLRAAEPDLKADPPQLSFATAYLLAKLAASADRSDDAEAFYRGAIRVRPDRGTALYDELAQHLLLADHPDRAAAVVRDALKHPGLETAGRLNFLFRLSQALEFDGKTDEALAALRKAGDLAPEVPLLHYQEGWVHYHAKHWDEAARLFEATIAKFPQDEEIVRRSRMSLSALYVETGDKAKGERVLEEVYQADPDDPGVNNDLGYLYADQGKKLEQAELMIRKAVAAEPQNPAFLDSLGWVLFRLERFEEAAESLGKAVALPGGDDATLWEHYGDSLAALGKPAEARDAWAKALELTRGQPKPDETKIEALEAKLRPTK